MGKVFELEIIDYVIWTLISILCLIGLLMVSTQAALIGALTLFLVFFMNYAILHQRRHEGYKAKERQTYVSVKSSILELKSKIKLFKIKGIETDELELILGKVKKEMINEQPPVM